MGLPMRPQRARRDKKYNICIEFESFVCVIILFEKILTLTMEAVAVEAKFGVDL